MAAVDWHISKERVAALFDGIVAITATLLVLEIQVPPSTEVIEWSDLMEAFRHFVHWGVSFAMIAMIWVEFHVVFNHCSKWDSGLLITTLCQLGAINLIPFAAGMVGEHPESLAAAIVFCATMGLNGAFVGLNALMVRRRRHLHPHDESHRSLGVRLRWQVAVYGGAVVVSVVSAVVGKPFAGIVAWIFCPLVLGANHHRLGRTVAGPESDA